MPRARIHPDGLRPRLIRTVRRREMGSSPPWYQRERVIWPPVRIAGGLIGLPSVLGGMACVPGLTALVFSGHGGPGWLVLALCFPVLLVNTYRLIVRPGRGNGVSRWRRAAVVVIAYLVLAYPVAAFAEDRITKDSGLQTADRLFYRLMTFPIGLVVPAWLTT